MLTQLTIQFILNYCLSANPVDIYERYVCTRDFTICVGEQIEDGITESESVRFCVSGEG